MHEIDPHKLSLPERFFSLLEEVHVQATSDQHPCEVVLNLNGWSKRETEPWAVAKFGEKGKFEKFTFSKPTDGQIELIQHIFDMSDGNLRYIQKNIFDANETNRGFINSNNRFDNTLLGAIAQSVHENLESGNYVSARTSAEYPDQSSAKFRKVMSTMGKLIPWAKRND